MLIPIIWKILYMNYYFNIAIWMNNKDILWNNCSIILFWTNACKSITNLKNNFYFLFNLVEELFYRGVGASDDPKYDTDCNLIPSNALYIKIVMGSVVDYFKPIERKTYCEMLQSHNLHQWSSNGKDWVIPLYHSSGRGGSTANYPSDGRKFLSFWGGNGNRGGCCHNSYSDSSAWNKAFNIFYGIGNLIIFLRMHIFLEFKSITIQFKSLLLFSAWFTSIKSIQKNRRLHSKEKKTIITLIFHHGRWYFW